jgi:hypothetical protein
VLLCVDRLKSQFTKKVVGGASVECHRSLLFLSVFVRQLGLPCAGQGVCWSSYNSWIYYVRSKASVGLRATARSSVCGLRRLSRFIVRLFTQSVLSPIKDVRKR